MAERSFDPGMAASSFFTELRPKERPNLRIVRSPWQETAPTVPEVAAEHLTGDIRILQGFPSAHLDHARDVWVYLPPGYEQNTDKRYPVLYMHDGNNLFDPSCAFGGKDWGVNETAEWMIQAGLLRPLIVVGVSNSPDRLAEYTWAACPEQGGGRGPDYARFLTTELVPYINQNYRTVGDRLHTGVMGSSLGGLSSLYLSHHAGDVFGLAGVMSPSIWWADRQVLRDLSEVRDDLRVWLDMGSAEGQTPEESESYLQDARALREVFEQRGYQVGRNLAHWEVDGADHSEAAWGHRCSMALIYLFGSAPRDPHDNSF